MITIHDPEHPYDPFPIEEITPSSHNYAQTWHLMPHTMAPQRVYARGLVSLLETNSVAIVGTRTPTELGEDSAYRIAHYFASEGYTIISGLAKGIDRAAHRGALDAGGHTIAVMGCSLQWQDLHQGTDMALVQRILEHNGLLISEQDHGRAYKESLLARNRLVAGHALATIPVQMGMHSGTLNTVNWAKQFRSLIWISQPRKEEAQHDMYAGIYEQMELLGINKGFTRADYPRMLQELQDKSSEVKAEVLRLHQAGMQA